ncbi:bcl-2-modifying factor-like isoform X1 [Sinocyclocheilus anshuiensis]|uniref:Bcl-2-modifying factor-like n=1 Tax=Sinocyclocheilus anshuiensis TaxID=1608454 RepID=A0A671M0H4_9TELE|nr:PREDICTED: bcl-2-modifying factor-like isoform X1 [Sinocyclocheilus anshuiensis]XP_016329606.1 PREDICTED: bcl-2-modifying factor-like isoform X1 [Sinocyclocheilus anshuiensis]
MDEDEDDVRRKGLQRWPSSRVQIKQTETAGTPPVSPSGMLPCRVHVEPTRFLYGNAGLLLLASPSRSQPPDVVLRQDLRMMDPAVARPERSVETLIGQKLQLIGDQFYQEHMMVSRVGSGDPVNVFSVRWIIIALCLALALVYTKAFSMCRVCFGRTVS